MFAMVPDGRGGVRVRRGWSAMAGPLLGALPVACAAVAVLLSNPNAPGDIWPECPIKRLGLNCPGCGGLRMAYALLHGDVVTALRDNAVALLAVMLFVWAWIAWTVGRWRGRPVRSWLHWRASPWVGPAVLVVWFVVRNLPFPPFTALHVS